MIYLHVKRKINMKKKSNKNEQVLLYFIRKSLTSVLKREEETKINMYV